MILDGSERSDFWWQNWDHPEECFFCGERLRQPSSDDQAFVMWGGRTSTILLHPECIMSLTLRLFRDVYEIEFRAHHPDLPPGNRRFVNRRDYEPGIDGHRDS
jgi:hypothetical protein